MLKTTLSVMLLVAAQNALYIQGIADRPRKLSKQELKLKLKDEIAKGLYDIGKGEGQCAQKTVAKALRKYFQKEYKCGWKYDENGRRHDEDKLENCLEENKEEKDEKLLHCIDTES